MIRSIHSKSFLLVPFHRFYLKLLSVMAPTQSSMDLLRGMDDNGKKGTIKARATIPVAGAIVTAAILLSGLSLIGSYQQPVLAQQQNMTGAAGNATNATMTGAAGNATNATMTGAAGNATNATMTGAMGDTRSDTTTAGGPAAAQGEGSGGGAAGGGETPAGIADGETANTPGGPAAAQGEGSGGGAAGGGETPAGGQ